MTETLIWQPYFSPVAIAALGVVLPGLVIFTAVRAFGEHPVLTVCMSVLRIAVIAAILILLMGPSVLRERQTAPGRQALWIMVDTSRSMLTADMDGQSRFAYAAQRWFTDETLSRLRRDYDLKFIGFDQSPRQLASEALAQAADQVVTGSTTQLAQCVLSVLGDVRDGDHPAGLLLLSDGRDSNDAPMTAPAALAMAKSVPIFTVPIGGTHYEQDVMVVPTLRQEYLLAGEQGTLSVKVVHTGSQQVTTRLHVRQADQIIHRDVAFGSERVRIFDFPVEHKDPGTYEYQVSVDPVVDEIETANNTMSVFLRVIKGRYKVLLLECQPYWDTKFLAQSLRRDPQIDLTQISQLAPQRAQKIVTRSDATEASIPASVDQWAPYDVVILGRGLEQVLSVDAAKQLVEYVSHRGGRVVFARGQAYDPDTTAGRTLGRELAVLEPVVWGRGEIYQRTVHVETIGKGNPCLALTDGSQSLEQVLAALPPLDVAPVVQQAKAASQVLATLAQPGQLARQGQPAMIAMPYGRGMVMAIVGEGLWRWNLQAQHDARLAGVFDRFWSNTVRWLAMGNGFEPDRDFSLAISRRSLQIGQALSMDMTRRFMGETQVPPQLVVVDPQGGQHELQPVRVENSSMRWTCQFEPKIKGVYMVRAAGSPTDQPLEEKFQVYDVDIERLQSAANPLAMYQLAELSGGKTLDPDQPQELMRSLNRRKTMMAVPPQPKFIWDQGWILILILGVAGLEWITRKKGGLL